MIMRICEYNFDTEDADNPGYSHHEVDYYAWTPQGKHDVVPNHRLSLRKNLVTQEWEFYRAYHRGTTLQRIQAGRECGVMIAHKPSGIEEVAFKTKDFSEALKYGNDEWNRWHQTDDYEREPDTPCTHGGMGTTAMFCAKLSRAERRLVT